MPIFYECQRCTACCRWPGQVKISEGEISEMARHLGIGESEFIQKYTRLRPDRKGLSLMDKPSGECIFLEEGDCRVQPVKPQQCRDFPNRWNFPGFQQLCRAREIHLSEEEYNRRVRWTKDGSGAPRRGNGGEGTPEAS